MIVMKFGGTSVQDAPAISRAIQVVCHRVDEKPVVVLSALGGSTNQLLEIADEAQKGRVEAAQAILERLKQHHSKVAGELLQGERLSETEATLQDHCRQIADIIQGLVLLGECTPRSKDAIASFGERMSTLLFAQALAQRGVPAKLLDSRQFIRTDDQFTNAGVLQDISFQEIREQIVPEVEGSRIPILQGFIGSTAQGVTTTIGRGGSDLTASLVGAALDAADIQIWTDVPGILTADPGLVTQAFKIKAMSFDEASELAYFGAKVLHPSALLPAISRNIPVHVCSSSHIDQTGTLICSTPVSCATPVKSIACKNGIVLLNIVSTRMLLAFGFLRRIFEVFDRHKTVVDVVATSEVSVSLTIDSAQNLDPILEELRAFGEVEVESKLAIICVVGDNLRSIPGIAARVFSAVREINVPMISQGASRINVTFLVPEDRMEEAVRHLHEEFFRDPDPELFQAV